MAGIGKAIKGLGLLGKKLSKKLKKDTGVPRGGITGSGVPKGHYLVEVPKDRPRTRWGGGDPHSRKYELKKIRNK